MKNKIESLKFIPYLIPDLIYRPDIELRTLLFALLGTEDTDNQHEILINSDQLLAIIYGIPVAKIPGYKNSASVLEIILPMRKHFESTNNDNKVCICNYFIHHFLKAINMDNYEIDRKKIEKGVPNTAQISIRTVFNQLDVVSVKTKKAAINAFAHDIRLINMHAFLSLAIPLKQTNAMTLICNKLMDYIKEDLLGSIKNPILTRKKLHAYIAIAAKLLEKKSIPDFHGAGSIVLALHLLHDALEKAEISISKEKRAVLAKLDALFSVSNNYKILRNKMDIYSIPALWIYSKDIRFSEENFNMFHRLEMKGKKYHEIAEIKKCIRIKMPIRSYSKTNLIALLGIDWIMQSDQSQSSYGFFDSTSSKTTQEEAELSLKPVILEKC